MGGSGKRFPIERRRIKSQETSPDKLQLNQPHTRRESDLVRMRIQHWMELANVALQPRNPHRRSAGLRTSLSAAPSTEHIRAAVKRARHTAA